MSLPWQIPGGQQVQRSVHRIGGSEGGPVIVRGDGAMQSENFVTGVSGWQFDAQGNLEANDGTFRGDISGASGTFTGALKIGSDPFSFNASGGAIWVGDPVFGSAPFRVSPLGFVYASGYYLDGGTIQQGSMTINAGEITTPAFDGTGTVVGTGNIRSANFVDGVSGWEIDGNGDAQFNNVTARGALSTGTTGTQRVFVGRAGNALVEFYSGDGDEIAQGFINVDVDNSGASDFAYINLVSPSMSVGDRCYIDLRHYDDGSREINTFSTAFNLNSGTVNINGTTNIDLDGGFLYFNGSSIFYDQVVFSNVVGIADGSASNPSLTFTDDANTGMFSPANDQIGLATGGVLRFAVTNTAMFAPGMATTTAAGLVVERFGSSGNEIYAETSSGLLKANQRPADNMVPQLLMLEPRMWDALSKDSEGNVTVTDEVKAEHNRGVTFDRPGFIVEEMADVWPEAVIFDDEIRPVGLDRMALITALVQAAKQFDQRLKLLELG